mgnify:CR=1 FL=1
MAFCHRRLQLPLQVHLANNILKKAESATHLGIVLTDDMKVHERVKALIQKGKTSFHSLLGYVVHPTYLNPLTSTILYRKLTMPSMLYGSELWNGLSVTDVEHTNRWRHCKVKVIQGFHNYTRSDMCESMIGLPPLVGQTVQRKLMFYTKSCHCWQVQLAKTSLCGVIYTFHILAYQLCTYERVCTGYM